MAQACARLALGDARLAARLGERGRARRCGRAREGFARAVLAGDAAASGRGRRCSRRRKAAGAQRRRGRRGPAVASELELVPAKERKRHEREARRGARRGERRARTQALDLTLGLAELWLRDVLCVCEGAPS